MAEIAWLLLDGGREAQVFDVDPVTRKLSYRKRLKFTRRLSPEEAKKVVDVNFPQPSEDVRMAADYLGRFKKGK
jgi:hypothetical protein